jgi:hypothetical protein
VGLLFAGSVPTCGSRPDGANDVLTWVAARCRGSRLSEKARIYCTSRSSDERFGLLARRLSKRPSRVGSIGRPRRLCRTGGTPALPVIPLKGFRSRRLGVTPVDPGRRYCLLGAALDPLGFTNLFRGHSLVAVTGGHDFRAHYLPLPLARRRCTHGSVPVPLADQG